eukprot:4976555-Prymnesium_polylepis.1
MTGGHRATCGEPRRWLRNPNGTIALDDCTTARLQTTAGLFAQPGGSRSPQATVPVQAIFFHSVFDDLPSCSQKLRFLGQTALELGKRPNVRPHRSPTTIQRR